MKTKFKNHFRELFLTTLCFLLSMTYGFSQDQLVVKGTVKGQKEVFQFLMSMCWSRVQIKERQQIL